MSISTVAHYNRTQPTVYPPPKSAESKNGTDSNRAHYDTASRHSPKKPVADTVTISKQAAQLAAYAKNA